MINLPRRKALALIAYLAMSDRPQNRDHLATLLWPDYDSQRGRSSLRRALITLNETPLKDHLHASRETIHLRLDRLKIDSHEFNQLIAEPPDINRLSAGVALYRGDFMIGFSLNDSAEFDNWQALQVQIHQQRLLIALSQLVRLYTQQSQLNHAILTLQRWVSIDPLNESAQCHLMRLYALTGQRHAALAQYEAFMRLLDEEFATLPEPATLALYQQIRDNHVVSLTDSAPDTHSSMPAVPPLFIGREVALMEIRDRLSYRQVNAPSQVVIQGWPGIGKSTLTAMLAHDPVIRELYPDGVLWASLGEYPDVLSRLVMWGRAIGLNEVARCASAEEASLLLVGALRDQRMLLIVDDVWEVGHAQPFQIGGHDCGMVITTRMNDLARALAHTPDQVYRLPILTIEQSLELLRTLAPSAVSNYPEESALLAADLEGLPLALQVAGRLLNAEMSLGWGVSELLAELRHGARLLVSTAPADRYLIAEQTTPTIAALLERSVSRLSLGLQERFAVLGVFAPKPATFSVDAIQSVWLVDDPRPDIRTLIDRGLLEPAMPGYFQMHALLVMYAKSMFAE